MQRTNQQNKSLHLLFKQTSDLMNSQGHTVKKLMDSGIDLPFTPVICKDIWKSIQSGLYGKKSTTELESGEIDKVFDVYCKLMGEIYGETVAFPSIEEIYYSNLKN